MCKCSKLQSFLADWQTLNVPKTSKVGTTFGNGCKLITVHMKPTAWLVSRTGNDKWQLTDTSLLNGYQSFSLEATQTYDRGWVPMMCLMSAYTSSNVSLATVAVNTQQIHVNQSIKLTNRSINQSISKSINQLSDQSLFYECFHCHVSLSSTLTYQLINQSINQSINQWRHHPRS